MSTDIQAPVTPTNLVDLLDQLILPPEPEPVSMMPQTVGWVVLALVLVCGLAYALYRLHLYRQHNAYRAVALSALSNAGDDPAAIAAVLRRCALAAYPRIKVAALSGEDWLTFLDKAAGVTDFSNGAGRALITAPYRAGVTADAGLQNVARRWVRRHKTKATI